MSSYAVVLGIMAAGYVTFEVLFSLMLFGFDLIKHKRKMKKMIPQTVDPTKLCKGPHSWITARVLTRDGPGTTQVCRVCGFISSSGKMASAESIDRIEESNRIREIESRLLKDFLTAEDDEMKKFFDSEIKGGLNFDKLATIHGAGMTFNQRFLVYKETKAEEIEKELKKCDS